LEHNANPDIVSEVSCSININNALVSTVLTFLVLFDLFSVGMWDWLWVH
jgi:hypothetical protein